MTKAPLAKQIEALAAEIDALKRQRDELVDRELEARAAADAADRARDEFLATLSHELRTPLNVVLGSIWRLRRGNLDAAAAARALESIERNTRLQVQLVEDLLDVSRTVTGKFRLTRGTVWLGPLVDAAVDAARPAAEAKGIRLEITIEAGCPPVPGDGVRLQQVFWNLMSNAVKFTPPGGQISVVARQVGQSAAVSISDTGSGIAPEFLPHVFEPFRQADSSTTRTHGGLGLGLAIVRHIVEVHGGSVQAESTGPGRGSVFTVSLPLIAVKEEKTDRRRAQQRAPISPPALSGLRVLVADAEADTRETITAALEHFGAEVTAVASVPEAVAEVSRTRPDVLLSDLQIRDEDGCGLLARVRALEGERGERIPAAAVTAYARAEDRAQALMAGFQLYLTKPVDPAELAAAVAALARRGKAE